MKRYLFLISTCLVLYSSHAFALLDFSVGIPFSHTISGEGNDGTELDSDGVSGYFVQIGVPILPGVGIDNYKTKLKNTEIELVTMIYNLYYQLPIPVINFTLGVGVGNTELECSYCSDYDKGSASQWYANLGFPIIPLFDLHFSYRSISTKIKAKTGGWEGDFSGNIMGLGIGFSF